MPHEEKEPPREQGVQVTGAAASAGPAPEGVPDTGGTAEPLPPDGTIDDETPSRGRRRSRTPWGKRGLRLPRQFRKKKPGAAPGIELHELPAAPRAVPVARITCIDYSPEHHQVEEVTDLAAFVGRH